MPLAAVVTIVVVAVLVAALAFYLTWIALVLRRVDDTLGKVTFGVRAVAHRTADLNQAIDEVNADLGSVASALDGLSQRLGADHPDARAS